MHTLAATCLPSCRFKGGGFTFLSTAQEKIKADKGVEQRFEHHGTEAEHARVFELGDTTTFMGTLISVPQYML